MKRALIIGLGCILIAGCGSVATGDGEPGSPLLAPADGALSDPAVIDSDGSIESVKPCPACNGRWNPMYESLSYYIPKDIVLTSPEMTLTLTEEEGNAQTACPLQGTVGDASFALTCTTKSKVVSAELTFASEEGLLFVPLKLDTTLPGDPPIVDVQ